MKITCGNITKDIEKGATVMQCLRALETDVSGVLAVQQGGRVLELTDVILREGEIRPLTLRDEEGRRIYERSLRFVALLAFRRLMPGQAVEERPLYSRRSFSIAETSNAAVSVYSRTSVTIFRGT